MTGFYLDAYELIDFTHDGLKIAISTYRSSGGIDRLRELHRIAMAKAKRDERHLYLGWELLRLHDQKGHLSAVWRSASGFHNLSSYVEQAWVFLREESIEQVTVDGTVLAHGLCSDGIRAYARGVSFGRELCGDGDQAAMPSRLH